jgi:hypothetical protein
MFRRASTWLISNPSYSWLINGVSLFDSITLQPRRSSSRNTSASSR